jgi:sugar O-acyltransferase (sialic acid O-acetyltransferase NeuD family)
VVGTCEKAPAYADWDFIVAIGNGKIRKKVQEAVMKNRLTVVSLVHPAATGADDVKIGKGTVVMAGAVINPSVQIGEGCIINTCASVDHDCLLEAYVHISVGAHVAGTVTIGQQTWVGAGAIVSNNVAIHAECIIGAGAVVIKDITESGTYIGVPAKKMPV